MKKYNFFSVLLALVLLFSLSAPALAMAPESHDHPGFPLVVKDGDEDAPKATAAIVVDGDTGEVLFEYNAHERRYPASVTKIMTSLVILDAIDAGKLSLDTQVTVSQEARDLAYDASKADLQVGEILTVEQLLYLDLVPSACDACNALAEAVTGLTGTDAYAAFADLMNAKAEALGMTGSHFTNPHGLHEADHYSTAYDIYLMAREAMNNELFRRIVKTTTYTVPETNMRPAQTYHTTNSLLDNWYTMDYKYSKAIGIKTGSTEEGGRCLASAAIDEKGRTFYCVVLGCDWVTDPNTGEQDRQNFSETIRLLEWAFGNFRHTTLLDENADDILREIPVTMSEDTDHVIAEPVGSIEADMPVDYDPKQAELVFHLPEEPLEAPVTKGQKVGSVELFYQGVSYGTLEMVAADDVARSEMLSRLTTLQSYWEQWWVKAALFGGIALILLLIIVICVARSKRKRRYSYSSRGRSSYRGGRR